MTTADIAEAVMKLPEKESIDLARRIVANIAVEHESSAKIAEAVQGNEDVVTGKFRGLNEAEFRDALR